MGIGSLTWGVNSATVSHLIHYDSLLQNATDVFTKCDSYFIKKCDGTLLQNVTFITKCDVYYELRHYI